MNDATPRGAVNDATPNPWANPHPLYDDARKLLEQTTRIERNLPAEVRAYVRHVVQRPEIDLCVFSHGPDSYVIAATANEFHIRPYPDWLEEKT